MTDESLLLDVVKLKELLELDYQETVSSLLHLAVEETCREIFARSRLDRVTFRTDSKPGQLDV